MKIIEARRARSLDVTLPALIVLVGAALPWGGSGRRDRSSFELVRVAERFDVLEGVAAATARAWLLLPLAVASIGVLGLLGRRWAAGLVGTVVGAIAVVLALAVHLSPLQPRSGLRVTLVGAALLVVAAIGAIATGSQDTRKPRTPPA
jgi:hypothetical protein